MTRFSLEAVVVVVDDVGDDDDDDESVLKKEDGVRIEEERGNFLIGKGALLVVMKRMACILERIDIGCRKCILIWY